MQVSVLQSYDEGNGPDALGVLQLAKARPCPDQKPRILELLDQHNLIN